MKRGNHDLVRPFPNPTASRCTLCQKAFRDDDDARGAKCKPRRDGSWALWQSPTYWSDRAARHKPGQS